MYKVLLSIFASLALAGCATTYAATQSQQDRGVCLETEIVYIVAPVTVIEDGEFVVKEQEVPSERCVKWSNDEEN